MAMLGDVRSLALGPPCRCRGRAWLLSLALLVGVDCLAVLIWSGAAALTVPDRRDGAAIAVLWGDQSSMERETRRRVRHAFALWREGPPQRIVICVGGRRARSGFNGAEQACDLLERMGVPSARLAVGEGSNDTVSNLRELADLAKRRGLPSATVVAGPIQALRASAMLDHGGLDLRWSTYPVWKVPPFRLWLMVHHDWLAMATLILPERLRLRMLDLARG